jgi:hypothetical protein
MARPTVMTEPVIAALRQAYLVGATNEEAAHYAGISARTIYEHIEKNPEFSQQIEAWKSEPILKAKQTIIKNLHDTKNAQWYLERKAKDFKQKVELDGGKNPIRVLLEAYDIDPVKISEGIIDDGQDDGAAPEAPASQT